MATLILEKLDFKPKMLKRDKEGHYIMTVGSIHQEDITVVNIYEPNIATLKYMNQKQTQLKGKVKNMNLIPHPQQ